MPTNQPTTEPFDRETFQIELAELIDHAREAGVDLRGAYDVRTPQPEHADYTVEVTEVAPRAANGDRRGFSPVN